MGAAAFLCLCADVRGQAVSTLATVHTFSGSSQNSFPVYGVIRGRDGNFYGATPAGGTSGNGTVFRLTTDGQLTVLHNFASDEPHAPTTALVQGSDGSLYGSAAYGVNDTLYATVFRTTLNGSTSNMHAFVTATEGSALKIPLTPGGDGNLYGATSADGPTGNGTLFRLTPSGKVIVLHSFTSAEGGSPTCPLAQGSDGNFYGSNGDGLFKITPGGVHTSVSPSSVQGGLVLGRDGNLYGTSTEGNRGCGSVVRVTPAGERADIYNFYYADGYVTNTSYRRSARHLSLRLHVEHVLLHLTSLSLPVPI